MMKTKVMKIYIILFTLLFDVIYCPLKAQVTEAQQVISELEDIISSYSDVDFDVEDQLERMSKVKKDGFLIPYSINNINEQELHALKLLSREQIKSFISYRLQIGSFSNLYGIQAVPLWDSLTISSLIPFLVLNNNSLMLPDKNEIWTFKDRWQTTLRLSPFNVKKRENWQGDNQYMGINLRYSPFDRLKMGISIEKDPGETLLKKGKPDYFSYFLTFQSKIKDGPTLFLGDFKTSWGQGLLNASYGSFKSINTTDISRNPIQINAHKSFAENGFYRGIILKYPLYKTITWIPMISFKKRDASFQSDSLNGISQLLLSGFHRTELERQNQEVTQIFHFGNRLQWQQNDLVAGINMIYQKMHPGQGKPKELYNQFYYSGKNYLGFSLDYHYQFSSWLLSGEIAYSKTTAFIFQLQNSLNKKLDIAILGRYYPKTYQGILAQAWGENSLNRNEFGLYLGLVYQLSTKWKISIFNDFYVHPWIRYQINSPTRGMEQRGRIAYEKRKGIKFYIEWHSKNEEETQNAIAGILFYNRNQYRSHIEIPGKSILWRARFDWGQILFGKKNLTGYSFWLEGWFKKITSPWSFSTRLGIYNTPGYEVRFYHFEQQVTGVYGLKPYYGQGILLHLVGKINIGKLLKWEIMMRKKWGPDKSITLTNQFKLG
jgi:hypothetical protein